MTWGEFKRGMEKAGVQDGDEIDYFDFSGDPQGIEFIAWDDSHWKYREMGTRGAWAVLDYADDDVKPFPRENE